MSQNEDEVVKEDGQKDVEACEPQSDPSIIIDAPSTGTQSISDGSVKKPCFNLHHNASTLLHLSPIQNISSNDNCAVTEESFNLEHDTSYAFKHNSSVLNMSTTPTDLKYHAKNTGSMSEEWHGPTLIDVKDRKTINIGPKRDTFHTAQSL